jgi:hypothetical protein
LATSKLIIQFAWSFFVQSIHIKCVSVLVVFLGRQTLGGPKYKPAGNEILKPGTRIAIRIDRTGKKDGNNNAENKSQ